MKTKRRFLALLLTLALLCTLGLTAFASGAPIGSITINGTESVPVTGKTFAAYKILDATLVDPADPGKGVAYSIPEAMTSFYSEKYHVRSDAPEFTSTVIAGIENEKSDMFAFASAALEAAKKAKVPGASASADPGAATVTIPNLPLGYYVIEDQGAATPISALMLDTVGNVQANIKADTVPSEKKIDGTKDTDPGTNGMVDSNTAAIGDKVPFVVTSKVPDMTGYSFYKFVMKDTLSKGLTFNNDVAITIGDLKLEPSQFTVTSVPGADGATNVKIVLNTFLQYWNQKGAPITITYSATVNENAVIGDKGNPNSVKIEYSNNPNDVHGGFDFDEDEPKGTTPEQITRTFVTELQVQKTDSAGKHLAGARFKLEGTRLNTVLITRDIFTENPDGSYYPLTDGTYTTAAPKEETRQFYVGGTSAKRYIKENRTETVTRSDEVVYDGFVSDDGLLKFTGVPAGTYTLTELVAPNGYNMLKEPITVTITCQLPETAEKGNAVWGVSTGNAEVLENGIIQVKVQNTTGTELPSTGGIGTTIFYVVGSVLMLAAVVLFITRKRMSAEG